MLHQVYGLVVLLFIIKLCPLPFAQTVHADAVVRLFGSIDWMNDLHWINSGVWTQLHRMIFGSKPLKFIMVANTGCMSGRPLVFSRNFTAG